MIAEFPIVIIKHIIGQKMIPENKQFEKCKLTSILIVINCGLQL
jgi:hypothetical protein